ncbi:MAG: peptide MFS transporter [Planctomycetes bacterium]|nr:peptide MFS transporter [Planctomycetota bacterium]
MSHAPTQPAAAAPVKPFPPVFWSANVTELFERAAYYSMASFVVIYLGQLGFGSYWPSNFNSLLWFLVFFLPILSGTIADQIGYRKSLLIAFVLLAAGYFLMGFPVWFGGSVLNKTIGDEVTAGFVDVAVVTGAVVLIGIGGSVIKPCISGTVQKVAGARATLGFAIFYMVINIGSLFGRGLAFVVRKGAGAGTIALVVGVLGLAAAAIVLLVRRTTKAERSLADVWFATLGFTVTVVAAAAAIRFVYQAGAPEPGAATEASLSSIFAVAALASLVAFLVVLLFFREPAVDAAAPAKPKRTVGRILLDMVLVLQNARFALYLLVMSGFYFLYNQVYNVLPLYVKKTVETNPAMELYTAANPFVIVCFQLVLTRGLGKMRPLPSMVVGTVVIGLAMLINVLPIWVAGGPQAVFENWLPLGSMFIVLTVALIALGELFTSPRMYEYIGALAPKGQEGLFLGYANLPLAIGALVGGPAGAFLFDEIMAHGSTKLENGLLALDPTWNTVGWVILTVIGLLSAASLWLFNRWVSAQGKGGGAAAG